MLAYHVSKPLFILLFEVWVWVLLAVVADLTFLFQFVSFNHTSLHKEQPSVKPTGVPCIDLELEMDIQKFESDLI